MKKMSKYKWLFIGIVWLSACYIIGQNINGDKTENDDNNDQPMASVPHAKISDYDSEGKRLDNNQGYVTNATDELGSFKVSFDGQKNVDDNPWGYNAGIIDVERIGECALLTPNTSLVLYETSNYSQIEFYGSIHPWVESLSDGVGLIVQYLDENGNLIEEITYDGIITNETNINISNDIGADIIKILCSNGINNDDNGDWMIIWEK